MVKKEKVLVNALLERKQSVDGKLFVTRIRALGLTAYGTSWDESKAKLKKMFATWVGLHRKSGNLEKALNKSNVQWWYEKDYTGNQEYEVVLEGGNTKIVKAKNSMDDVYLKEKELVAA